MTRRRDDDALSWDGDEDPTLDVGVHADGDAASRPSATLPEGYIAVGKGSEALAASGESTSAAVVPDAEPAAPAAVEDDAPPMGNVELISLGVLGGFAVLYAVGWLIGGLRLQGTAEFLVAPLAYQVSLWLAVIAPPVWFVTVLALTRRPRAWVRFAWLIAGVVLLVPWPFIMLGAIGR